MILHWVVSATLLGALLALIGTCLAPLTARARLPRRWLWLGLMIASLAWPLARAIAPHAVATSTAGVTAAATGPAPMSAPVQHWPADRTILLMWGALSLILGSTLAVSHWRTLRLMAHWEERSLFDAPIAIAPDFGPAAVGLIRPRVVIPGWVLELPADEQRLVLSHEQQHIRAGDHLVLLAGLAMVVLLPWNIGLWWQLRRLRIGMELDCDARVAPAPRDRPRYAELLLRARTHHQTRRLALALAPAPSALAERLMALLDRARPSRRQLAGWSATAAVGAMLVIKVPVPDLTPLLHHADRQLVVPPVTPPLLSAPVVTHASAPATHAPKRMQQQGVIHPAVDSVAAARPAATPARKPRYDSLIPYVPGPPTMARGGIACRGECVSVATKRTELGGASDSAALSHLASGYARDVVTTKAQAIPDSLLPRDR